LHQAGLFTSLSAVQAALDDWVRGYNAERPHQALDTINPVTPAERFEAVPDEERALLPLWTPPALSAVAGDGCAVAWPLLRCTSPNGIEFERVVPASGHMYVESRQIWMGPTRLVRALLR
jgi:hypothetical protein